MKTKVFILSLVMILASMEVMTQESNKKFAFEFNSGASVALSKINGTELNTGFGFEASFHYNFLPHTAIYAGWGWNHFGADNSFAGEDVGFEETGYIYGLQFKHPAFNNSMAIWLRAGGLYNHIEIENADGDIIEDTGHGFGFQAAAGVDINLGSNWSLTPGIKFNTLTRDVEIEGDDINLKYNYLQLRVGISKKF